MGGEQSSLFFILILTLNINIIVVNKRYNSLYTKRQQNQPKLSPTKPIQIRREPLRHFKGIVTHTERVSSLKRGV